MAPSLARHSNWEFRPWIPPFLEMLSLSCSVSCCPSVILWNVCFDFVSSLPILAANVHGSTHISKHPRRWTSDMVGTTTSLQSLTENEVEGRLSSSCGESSAHQQWSGDASSASSPKAGAQAFSGFSALLFSGSSSDDATRVPWSRAKAQVSDRRRCQPTNWTSRAAPMQSAPTLSYD